MDASEMIEIEMLESEIGRLKIDNQNLKEEIERLRSASDAHEKAQCDLKAEFHLFQSKKQQTEENAGKIVLEQAIRIQELKDELERVTGERDGLRAELQLKNEEVEQLFLDLQVSERTNQEDWMELRNVSAERDRLLEEKERWEDRVDKITEDNTLIILTLLASQNDLEELMNRRQEVMEAFKQKVLEMVRRTKRIVNSEEEDDEIAEGETSGEMDDEIENVVMVLATPVEKELKEIEEAAVGAVGRRSLIQ